MKDVVRISIIVLAVSGLLCAAGKADVVDGLELSGAVGGVGQVADVVVWRCDDGIFHANKAEKVIYSHEKIDYVIQHALDSLTPGRTVKEKVKVVSSGTIVRREDNGSAEAIRVPSYTILDIPATLKVALCDDLPDGARTNNRVLVKVRNARHVDIPNINIVGDIGWGLKVESSSNIRIGHVFMDVTGWSPIRIDNEGTGRSTDIQINSAYIEGSTGHAIETRGVDRIQIGQVIAKHNDGCAVLLNETNDANINSIIAYNPESATRYATFRVTRNDYGRITVNDIISIDAPRGIHIHTGTGDIVLSNIYIDGARDYGIRLSSSPNTIITNGIIKNTHGTAITVYTWDEDPTPDRTANGVSISNMRIYDDRPQQSRTQTHGIVFAGVNGQIFNNDLREAGTVANLTVDSATTLVRDNIAAGIAQGTVRLKTGASPAARVQGLSGHRDVTLDLRAKTREAPKATFSWDYYFEYNGQTEQWDLVFEWRTDPGEDIELDYIVDQPQVNLGL